MSILVWKNNRVNKKTERSKKSETFLGCGVIEHVQKVEAKKSVLKGEVDSNRGWDWRCSSIDYSGRGGRIEREEKDKILGLFLKWGFYWKANKGAFIKWPQSSYKKTSTSRGKGLALFAQCLRMSRQPQKGRYTLEKQRALLVPATYNE